MGYKLADGSDSDLYEVGDDFCDDDGKKLRLIEVDGDRGVFQYRWGVFSGVKQRIEWRLMEPDERTKLNYKERDMEAMEAGIIKRYEDNVNYVTKNLNASQHQTCVPIQFIWCEGQLHPASDASKIVFTGDSCEQIGAVLYVRDEE